MTGGDVPAWRQQLDAQLADTRELADVSDIIGKSGTSRPVEGSGSAGRGSMDGLLNGMIYSGQISNDVYGYQQGVREPNGHPEY